MALHPSLDQNCGSLAVDAVLPTGRRALLPLRSPRADWPRRYWLTETVELPAGTQIEVTAIPAAPQSQHEPSPQGGKLHVAIDFVPK